MVEPPQDPLHTGDRPHIVGGRDRQNDHEGARVDPCGRILAPRQAKGPRKECCGTRESETDARHMHDGIQAKFRRIEITTGNRGRRGRHRLLIRDIGEAVRI